MAFLGCFWACGVGAATRDLGVLPQVARVAGRVACALPVAGVPLPVGAALDGGVDRVGSGALEREPAAFHIDGRDAERAYLG
ncbi:hypothetical protein Airi01_102910 [Actinoallomurus iriomotensis]|uniref:Uncharacterized protein n=1 Tax=Actinoallomurus iriomotensis TaxID=478107 RepID=A0A9W6RUE8_9ACTN|nr:hypothetical protein Airi01_102910 [Actinoallomurus iriomotensis]